MSADIDDLRINRAIAALERAGHPVPPRSTIGRILDSALHCADPGTCEQEVHFKTSPPGSLTLAHDPWVDRLVAERDTALWSAAYWEWLGRFSKRVWLSGWGRWALTVGTDEMSRRTLVLGPLVVALWRCRCEVCKADKAHLESLVEAGPGVSA